MVVVKFCAMASHGYLRGLALPQDHAINRPTLDCQQFLPCHGPRHDVMRVGFSSFRHLESEEPWKPVTGFPEPANFVKLDSPVNPPLFAEVQDSRPSSLLFSSVISEHCSRQGKISQILASGGSEQEGSGFDIAMLSELLGLQSMKIDLHQQPSLFIIPDTELYTQKPLLDLVGGLVGSSRITIQPDGRALFNGSGTEVRDLLSLIVEFYLPKTSAKGEKYSMLVPQYSWLGSSDVGVLDGSPFKLQAISVAPLKSPDQVKTKSPKKKIGKKRGTERDLYEKNYFHACESLLSIIMADRGRKHRKTAAHSLKKSGPELPQLLNQFSASIAGTGLAVVLSVIARLACSGVPFCSSKFLSTGLGFGLVWLSWAVMKLRDTVVYVGKNPEKLGLKEEELMNRVEKNVKDIYFRAATIMAVAVLRFA